jgi:hypothetical protein
MAARDGGAELNPLFSIGVRHFCPPGACGSLPVHGHPVANSYQRNGGSGARHPLFYRRPEKIPPPGLWEPPGPPVAKSYPAQPSCPRAQTGRDEKPRRAQTRLALGSVTQGRVRICDNGVCEAQAGLGGPQAGLGGPQAGLGGPQKSKVQCRILGPVPRTHSGGCPGIQGLGTERTLQG